MELAGKYAKTPTVQDAIALAKTYVPDKVLATGDPHDELVTRLLPAAISLGLDPGAVIESVVGVKQRL